MKSETKHTSAQHQRIDTISKLATLSIMAVKVINCLLPSAELALNCLCNFLETAAQMFKESSTKLATGRYAQLAITVSYISLIQDQMVMPYGRALLKVPTHQRLSQHQAVPATEDSPALDYDSEKESDTFDIECNGDDIYSTVDACQTAQEMWEAIERLQQVQRQRDAKPITPPSESASEEDSDPEQAQKDKDMQKFLALIAKYFKKLYKPTNNNLRTSSNTRNKNVDTTPRYRNDNQTGQFGNQRAVNVVGARETVGGPVWKLVIVMSLLTHRICGIDDIQDDQNDVECDELERVGAHANLLLILEAYVDENKKIQKQLKKANATLTQELTECKSILAETSRTLEESNSIRSSCLVSLQN
ncbi:hypothetical protein Tco_1548465 [Tanacetum coccineum]